MENQSTIREIPADVLKYCKCHFCNCYVNVTPVRFVNNQLSCGRCKNVGEGVQLHIVEALLDMYDFPCRYEPQGCKALLQFKNAKLHEDWCDFKSVGCTSESCSWSGTKKEIQQHFEQHHAKQVINSNTSILINLKEFKTFNLLYVDKTTYLVNITNDGNCIKHTMTSFTALEALKYSYSLKFTTGSRDLSFNNQKILVYDSIVEVKVPNKRISIELLSAVFTNSYDVNVIICIQDPNKDCQSLSVKDVSCPVCVLPLIEDIYVKMCGHSVCETCFVKEFTKLCTQCSTLGLIVIKHRIHIYNPNFRTRNYNLESLIQKVSSSIKK